MAKNEHHTASISPALDEILEEHGLELGSDKYLRWHLHSHHHPRNWHWVRKCYDVGLIMFLEMTMSAMSTVGTAVSNQARSEYDIENDKTLGYFAFTSIYLLGEGVGGIFLPPVSESFGRKFIYAAATFLNCIFCILVAAVPPGVKGSLALAIFARGAAGIMGSVPATVAPGSLEDIFGPKERIWAVAAWTTASNVGVLMGPIYGSYVTTYLGWRWVFWIASIVMFTSFILTLFLRESRSTILLQQRLDLILSRTSIPSIPLRIRNPDAIPSLHAFLTDTLFRPLRLLITEPIVILCSALNAISFAMIYGLTEGLTIVYSNPVFHLPNPQTTSSLAFLPLIIGLFLSLPFRAYDVRRYNKSSTASSSSSFSSSSSSSSSSSIAIAASPKPEEKLTSFAIAVPALALGLWAFAWTIPPLVPHAPLLLSLTTLVPVGFAINDLDAVLCGYMADAYTMYASSAFAALSLLRSLCAAAFPLFAGSMFKKLGGNGAASVLAGVATLFCIAPWVLRRWGEKLREGSEFARCSAEMSEGCFGGGGNNRSASEDRLEIESSGGRAGGDRSVVARSALDA